MENLLKIIVHWGKIFDEKLNNCVKGSCYKTTYINFDESKKHEKCVV